MNATEQAPQDGILVRRRRVVLGLVAGCAVVSTGGLAASVFIKSPQQVLADSSGPAPSLVTAKVELRALSSTLVTRGTVVAGTSIEVTPVVAGAGSQVVTAVQVKVGDQISSGQ